MAFVTTKDGVNIYYKDWVRKKLNPLFSITAGH